MFQTTIDATNGSHSTLKPSDNGIMSDESISGRFYSWILIIKDCVAWDGKVILLWRHWLPHFRTSIYSYLMQNSCTCLLKSTFQVLYQHVLYSVIRWLIYYSRSVVRIQSSLASGFIRIVDYITSENISFIWIRLPRLVYIVIKFHVLCSVSHSSLPAEVTLIYKESLPYRLYVLTEITHRSCQMKSSRHQYEFLLSHSF